MAKKSLSYLTRLARQAAQRRINMLGRFMSKDGVSYAQKQWAESAQRELQKLSARTRMTEGNGKRIRERTQEDIKGALQDLRQKVQNIPTNINPEINSFKQTQTQINLASTKNTEAASIYSREQVHLFYRVTQRIWEGNDTQLEGKNERIYEYYNEQRVAAGKKPLSFKEIFETITSKFDEMYGDLKAYGLDQSKWSKETQEWYARVNKNDSEATKYADYVTAYIAAALSQSFEDVFFNAGQES